MSEKLGEIAGENCNEEGGGRESDLALIFHDSDQADSKHNLDDAGKHDDKITFERNPARNLSQKLAPRKGEVPGSRKDKSEP